MTTEPPANALRAARTAHGWSLTTAAERVVALAAERGVPVAGVASLRTQLSRWENGRARPEPQYRELLAELLERTPEALGIAETTAPAVIGAADALRAALAEAAAVDEHSLQRWRDQLAAARRLDDELGAAGAGAVVRAQVDQLDTTLRHTIGREARAAVAAVLAETATLAGEQALDRAEPHEAWSRYRRAADAAAEAEDPAAAARAGSGLVGVLLDVGEPRRALDLLGTDAPETPAARAEWAAALALAHAAAGADSAARAALDVAEHALGAGHERTVDLVRLSGPPVELADLRRRRGHTLACLADPAAVSTLRAALAAGPRSVRHRAAVHADLAGQLAHREPAEAAEHARAARVLAARIGSRRIPAALDPAGGRR